MSEPDPPSEPNGQNAPYFRPGSNGYGDVGRLKSLRDGYFGLNAAFVINIFIDFTTWCGGASCRTLDQFLLYLACAVPVVIIIMTFMVLPHNRKIANGLNWEPWAAVLASILIGVNSTLCCGAVGYALMQNLAFREMRRYGVTGWMFGVRKRDIDAKIAAMEAMPQAPQSPFSL